MSEMSDVEAETPSGRYPRWNGAGRPRRLIRSWPLFASESVALSGLNTRAERSSRGKADAGWQSGVTSSAFLYGGRVSEIYQRYFSAFRSGRREACFVRPIYL